jgi:hypothetical protein
MDGTLHVYSVLVFWIASKINIVAFSISTTHMTTELNMIQEGL